MFLCSGLPKMKIPHSEILKKRLTLMPQLFKTHAIIKPLVIQIS